MAEESPEPRNVAVYVRVRPLLEADKVAAKERAGGPPRALVSAAGSKLTGFTGVFGPNANNDAVFQECFRDRLDTVVRGGSASLFAYGYTGSGKTHTILGYGGEKGLYASAVERLLALLAANDDETGSAAYLAATACEIYNGEMYDLLNGGAKCTVQATKSGQVCIFGPKETCRVVEEFPELFKKNMENPALITRSRKLRSVMVRSVEDLETLSDALAKRAIGSSTEHTQSSRSHCVLQLSVVNDAMLEALETLESVQALVPALEKAKDGIKYRDSVTKEVNPLWQEAQYMLEVATTALDVAQAAFDATILNAPSMIKGTLLMVDLAGADYDSREVGKETTKEELRESIAINKSLFALKQVFRCVAKAPGAPRRPPFRDSLITRILENAIQPQAGTTRRNIESVSVMVVAVSPSSALARKNANSLRYAQLLTSAN